MNLFRREVLEHRHNDWLGSVQLIRPASLTMSTLLVALTLAAVATFLMIGQYTRKERVTGYLVPETASGRLQAQLFAPSSAIGFVRPDQPVQLRYPAFPYQKFGHHAGEVLQVSRVPLRAAELASLPFSAPGAIGGEPLYRITVQLDRQNVVTRGQAQPLAPGMLVEADVMLERRRLIEWLFEPVLGIADRV